MSWNFGSAILGGLLATLVLTTVTAAGRSLGFSRMGMSFILGTIFTPDRKKAEIIGFLFHLVNGWAFAFLYAVIFERWSRTGVLLGSGLGLAHGVIVLVALLPLVPQIHPRMATEEHGPDPTRALEPPGFLGLNYGRRTPILTLVAHILYGAIIGGFYQLA
ncbi:MAG: hypothetical protein ACOC8K_00800 [Gemmatimonadota bacterium]